MLSEHLQHLDTIAQEDAQGLRKAEEQYGSSWKQRGGVGAFMMLARKWDRIEKLCSSRPNKRNLLPGGQPLEGDRYDIFEHILADERPEGVIDDIRDLRRYLLLVESEMRKRGAVAAQSGNHRDNSPEEAEDAGAEPDEGYVNQDPDHARHPNAIAAPEQFDEK